MYLTRRFTAIVVDFKNPKIFDAQFSKLLKSRFTCTCTEFYLCIVKGLSNYAQKNFEIHCISE